MTRRTWPFFVATAFLLALAGCSRLSRPERPAWRDQAEEACLAQGAVQPSEFLQPARPIEGPGICGLNHPFKVYALAGGTVRLKTANILACSMIPALDDWIKTVVQPDAVARFGEPVVQINTMGTYNCRGINNENNTKLSEHAFANAMDVGGFVLQSGREVNVRRDWKSSDAQQVGFLQDAHAGACNIFTTVLGPGANIFHYDHIHMDLAQHGNTSRGPRRYCKPVPAAQIPAPQIDNLPDPPAIDEDQDMARAPASTPSYTAEAARIATAAPPPYRSVRPTPQRDFSQSHALALAPMERVRPSPGLDLDQAGTELNRPRRRTTEPEGDITSLIRSQAR